MEISKTLVSDLYSTFRIWVYIYMKFQVVLYQLDFDSGGKNEKLEKNPDVQCQKNILLTSLPRNEKNYIS
jgi:hypothetical protein